MLSVADFLDLVAEHTACRCPAVTHASAPDNSDCPRNLSIRAHREAARHDGPWPIPPASFAIDQVAAYLADWDEGTPRVVIAVLLWRVTAEFAGDTSPLVVPSGHSITDTAEQYVRAHWQDAELSNATRQCTIREFLDDLGLLDDYKRVKQDQQEVTSDFHPHDGLRTRRSFCIPAEAWYGATVRQEWAPQIRGQLCAGVDVLDEDGEPDGTGLGEWTLTWTQRYDGLDLELQISVDAWKVFVSTEFPALLALLGVDDPAEPVPSLEQVSRALLAAGWIDSTVRATEIKDQRRPGSARAPREQTR